MNTLESLFILDPHGNNSECAKLSIDDLSKAFILRDIVDIGTEYTLNFWVKSDVDGNFTVCGNNISTTTEWRHFSIVFTAVNDRVEFLFGSIGTYYIYHPKLEKGNKPTDWTPAPEDLERDIEELSASVTVNADSIVDIVEKTTFIDGEVSYAKSEVEKLADRISNLVVDKNGMSLMTQTADGGWVLNMAEYDDAIGTTSGDIQELFGKLQEKDTDIAAVQQTLKDMGVKTAYIHEGTYNGQPCIELGENDSDFKLRITNTEIQFIVGSGSPAAYMNNKEMHIRKAVIDDELQMGGFAWVKHGGTNQNMGLIWRGVSS